MVSWPTEVSNQVDKKEERRSLEKVSSKRILAYRGRLWSKAGDVYRKKKTIFNPDMIYGYEPKTPQPFPDLANQFPPAISLFPLGIYPLDWLCTETWTCSVHLTLLRRSFQSKHQHTLSTHWLRVGYDVERIAAPSSSEGDEEVESHRFTIVAYLPNAIAKCLGAALQGSWVDLEYVSRPFPHSSLTFLRLTPATRTWYTIMVLSYLVSSPPSLSQIEHLQTALSPLAGRVVPLAACNGLLFDQCCRVSMESFGARHQEEDEPALPSQHRRDQPRDSGLEPKPVMRRIHSMVEEELLGENDDSIFTPEEIGIRPLELSEPDFRFESFVAKVSAPLPVGSYYLNRKVLSIVSISLLSLLL
jgi:hypothetical protein